jgi:hypothetical protein
MDNSSSTVLLPLRNAYTVMKVMNAVKEAKEVELSYPSLCPLPTFPLLV